MDQNENGYNIYTSKIQLSNGIWVFERGNNEWCDEMNYNLEVLNSLLNSSIDYSLTIKDSSGTVLGTFNNSEDKIITVPKAEEIKTLTIKNEDGDVLAVYDGSEAKMVTLTAPQIQEQEFATNSDIDNFLGA